MEEPVVEEPVVEEPVHVPEPLSPADIESFDIPIVPDTSEGNNAEASAVGTRTLFGTLFGSI